MEKKFMEAENASSKDFVKERIKERPVSKKKLMRRMLTTVLSAIVFGVVFCIIFLFLEPRIDTLLHKEEQVHFVEFPEDDIGEEMLPENMLTEEQAESGEIKEILGISDFEELQDAIANIANTARKSMVSVTSTTEENIWFENSSQNKSFSSGVIVADNGQEYLILIRTNAISRSENIVVIFYNGKQASATLKQQDATSGYSVVAVKHDDLTQTDMESIKIASLGSSNLSTLLGTTVIALGNVLSTGEAICYGRVTSVGSPINLVDSNYKLMTTDIYGSTKASGVLVNLRGQVVGIIDNGYNSLDVKNMVSAIGISEMKPLIQNLSNNKPIPSLGVKGISVTTSVNTSYGVPYGAYITSVVMNSPAMLAGLQSGDIITEYDGTKINGFSDLTNAILNSEKMESVKLKVERETNEGYADMSVWVTLK